MLFPKGGGTGTSASILSLLSAKSKSRAKSCYCSVVTLSLDILGLLHLIALIACGKYSTMSVCQAFLGTSANKSVLLPEQFLNEKHIWQSPGKRMFRKPLWVFFLGVFPPMMI